MTLIPSFLAFSLLQDSGYCGITIQYNIYPYPPVLVFPDQGKYLYPLDLNF